MVRADIPESAVKVATQEYQDIPVKVAIPEPVVRVVSAECLDFPERRAIQDPAAIPAAAEFQATVGKADIQGYQAILVPPDILGPADQPDILGSQATVARAATPGSVVRAVTQELQVSAGWVSVGLLVQAGTAARAVTVESVDKADSLAGLERAAYQALACQASAASGFQDRVEHREAAVIREFQGTAVKAATPVSAARAATREPAATQGLELVGTAAPAVRAATRE